MNPSPLQLDRYIITEFSFKSHVDYQYPGDYTGKVDISDLKCEVSTRRHKTEKQRWLIDLTLDLPQGVKKRYPYSFKISLVGFFTVSDLYPDKKVDFLVQANSPALLYSAAREFIATVTGRGPYLALWLPSVMFLKPNDNVALDRKKAAMSRLSRKTPRKIRKKRKAVSGNSEQ